MMPGSRTLVSFFLCMVMAMCETLGPASWTRLPPSQRPSPKAIPVGGGLGFLLPHYLVGGIFEPRGRRVSPISPDSSLFAGRATLTGERRGRGRALNARPRKSQSRGGFGGITPGENAGSFDKEVDVSVYTPLCEAGEVDEDQQLMMALLSGELVIEDLGLGHDEQLELQALLKSIVEDIRPCPPKGVPIGAPQTAGGSGEVMMWTASPAAFNLASPLTDMYADLVENVPGAVYIHNVLSKQECEKLIDLAGRMGFTEHDMVKNLHASCTYVADIESVIAPLFERCRAFVPPKVEMHGIPRDAVGLNARLRVYRYQPDGRQTFRPHTDDSFPMSACVDDHLEWDVSDGKVSSAFTLLLYLNEEFDGGETAFFESGTLGPDGEQLVTGPLVASVKPRTGSALIFPQTCHTQWVIHEEVTGLFLKLIGDDWRGIKSGDGLPAPVHEGSPVVGKDSSPKFVVRSDIMYSL